VETAREVWGENKSTNKNTYRDAPNIIRAPFAPGAHVVQESVFQRLPAEWTMSAADFEDQLAAVPAAVRPFDMSSRGWVASPRGRLLHAVNQQL